MKQRPPGTIEAVAVGADDALWLRLVREGRAAYRVDSRGAARLRARLQSAKILDASGGFLCEALIQDQSKSGFRLLLARDCALPSRFGVHVDLTGEVVTAAQAWRRSRIVGAHILTHAPPAPLKPSDRVALAGKYYAVRD